MWSVSFNSCASCLVLVLCTSRDLPNRPETESSDAPKESEEEMKPKWSIQERIFAMESKIEEDRMSGSLTSSGIATPRKTKLR